MGTNAESLAKTHGTTLKGAQNGGSGICTHGQTNKIYYSFTPLKNIMASIDGDIELEDGEINDLEDGEIDEEIFLPTESNSNIFSRLEPRQPDPLREQRVFPENLNSLELNSRDFVSHNSGPLPARWNPRGGSLISSRGRFPRGRASPGTARGRGKTFRGNGREMIGRGKPFPSKRENTRRCILYFT